jgi:acetylornithine deacetylase
MGAPLELTEALDPVVLAARLMEIDSTSGGESGVIDWMNAFLAEREWHVRRIAVSPTRDDLFATTSADVPHASLVTLSTHLDTVPPYIPPKLEGDVLHGRGACDA